MVQFTYEIYAYYYMVKAHNDDGTSSFSHKANATTYALAAPENLEATTVSDVAIDLTWDEVDGADDYYIFRSENLDGPFTTQIDTTEDLVYHDLGLTTDTTYYYKIKAHNADGTSNYSDRAQATTD